jgi:pimeloyl-ACP methyl ester carboxylesterase
MPPTIVLVHGAFAESSSWDTVIDPLLEAGHPVIAAANPLRGVAADAAAVSDLVRTIDGPVVLVAHSYGGMVISNVDADAGEIVGPTERPTSTSLWTPSTTSSARTSPRRRPHCWPPRSARPPKRRSPSRRATVRCGKRCRRGS